MSTKPFGGEPLPKRFTDSTEPTIRGRAGNAWLIDLKAATRRRGIENDPRATVTLPCWIVAAAWAHPLWSHYAVLGIALRDVPGVPKAKINLQGATHEVMVYALDPDFRPAVDEMPHYLTPVNFVGQFVAADDQSAAERIRQAVQEVADGTLSPDTDFRRQWVQRFSASNLKAGALDPDFIAINPAGGVLAHGTGAANVRNLQQIVDTAATLRADESKPQ